MPQVSKCKVLRIAVRSKAEYASCSKPIGIMTGSASGWSGFEVWHWQEVFLFSEKSRSILGLRHWSFNRYRGSFQVVKQPVRCVGHPRPSRAKVKNESTYTSASPTCLHGLDKLKLNQIGLLIVYLVSPTATA
jgi:hypothetical protein